MEPGADQSTSDVDLDAEASDVSLEFDINELSDVSGHSVRNLRAYLQLGLLHQGVKRGRSTIFNQSHVRRLQQVDRFRQRGYSLAAIKDVVSGRGDAMLSDDVASMRSLINRWVNDDDHQWTFPELERLLPSVEDRPALLRAVLDSGMARLVDDGLVIGRPEFFRAGFDLEEQGLPVLEALQEMEELERQLAPVVEFLVGVQARRFADSGPDPLTALQSVWPSVMMVIGSQLSRELYARAAAADNQVGDRGRS